MGGAGARASPPGDPAKERGERSRRAARETVLEHAHQDAGVNVQLSVSQQSVREGHEFAAERNKWPNSEPQRAASERSK